MSVSRRDKLAFIGLCLAGLGVSVGCSRKPDDNQIIQSVQSQVQKDSAIGGEIKVASTQGVVTLDGHVSSEAARTLAAREAGDVAGVREVINNLTVSPSTASAMAAQAQAPNAGNRSAGNTPPRHSARSRTARRSDEENTVAADERPAQAAPPASPAQPPAPAPVPATDASALAPPAPAVPPPPPAPTKYTIPAGTTLSVRLINALDSSRNKVGDTFRATLNTPIRMDGEVVIPAGVDVEGRVADSSNSGRFSGHSELRLELTKLTYQGNTYALQTQAYDRSAEGRGKGTAETVGGGAALGAIIGAIAGGGKGAAIGTVAGAGAGGVARGAEHTQKVSFPSETVLTFKLQEPVTVVTKQGTDQSRTPMSASNP